MNRPHPFSVIVTTLVGLALIAGVIVGGYQLGWWLKGNAVNRNAEINRQSYEVQQTYREKARDDIASVAQLDTDIANPAYATTVAQLRAQRIAVVSQTCDAIARLATSGAGVDPDVQSFNNKECILP